jgi:AraC-like DNA-binding protein
MTIELLSEPLSRFRAVDTSDQDELAHTLQTVYNARPVAIPSSGTFHVRANFVQLEDIALGFNTGRTPLTIGFHALDCARLQIALSGLSTTHTSGQSVAIDPQQACITSPGEDARTEFGDRFEHLLLRVNHGAIERKLTALLGSKPKGAIVFEPTAPNHLPQAINLRRLIAFFNSQLNSPIALPPLVLGELQQAITLMFLHAYPHNFSRFLDAEERDTAPKHVRRVEEYIEANWMRPLNIEKLTALTGISARGIFKAFQRSRGYSPMAFAKRVRLQHARNMLGETELQETTVTATAYACGFANLGHFAKDYREMFGERPSETLQRARG